MLMKHNEKSNALAAPNWATMCASGGQATITDPRHLILTSVVEDTYTTPKVNSRSSTGSFRRGDAMAFVRRKGNAYYLVHNVRRGDKVQQLHLARLGERARITDQIVREVAKKHPFIELNWRSLREQLNSRIDLADP